MADIRTAWDAARIAGDWLLASPGLDTDKDLETAVIISLFTDARAKPDDPLEEGEDPRGWWGDTEAQALHGAGPIGSRLWLLRREKQTEEVRQRAITYAREALAWLRESGAARRIDVEASWAAPGFLLLEIAILKPDGRRQELAYEWAWDQVQPF